VVSLFGWVAGLQAVRSYRRQWLAKDIVAGVVLTTLLVPQGVAYAELAGLPPITGLYTSIMCLLGYAAFGPSRILVLGPDSSLGPMIAATILPLIAANGDEKRAIALASLWCTPSARKVADCHRSPSLRHSRHQGAGRPLHILPADYACLRSVFTGWASARSSIICLCAGAHDIDRSIVFSS
jgi:hypothetical protein